MGQKVIHTDIELVLTRHGIATGLLIRKTLLLTFLKITKSVNSLKTNTKTVASLKLLLKETMTIQFYFHSTLLDLVW